MRAEAKVPGSVIGWEDSELTAAFDFSPGTPETGRYGGPPENYDPGEPPAFENLLVTIEVPDALPVVVPLDEADEEKVVEWLVDNYEPEIDEGPDPDDLRDDAIERRLADAEIEAGVQYTADGELSAPGWSK